MPTIELLVGMIASGKSTYARRRAGEGALVVAHDDLTAMLHARHRYEPGLRECYRRVEEAIVATAIHFGRDVVIDRTHLTRESRARWLQFARSYSRNSDVALPVVAVAFPILPAELHARRRDRADGRGRPLREWLQVAGHHAEQARAEPLELAEGFARIDAVAWAEGEVPR